jgi:hypothetical protein
MREREREKGVEEEEDKDKDKGRRRGGGGGYCGRHKLTLLCSLTLSLSNHKCFALIKLN